MILQLLIILAGFAFSADRASVSDCSHDDHTFRCVKYLRNYDGDTITFNIPGVHALLGKEISVRVLGIDTPEKTGTKPCEKEKARDAQRLVENILSHGARIELRNVGRDKYFRILAEVWVDGKSVAELLTKNKLAYAYAGGRKPASVQWCSR